MAEVGNYAQEDESIWSILGMLNSSSSFSQDSYYKLEMPVWSCLASFKLVDVLMFLRHLAYGECTETCKKKQWFIVNHSENRQRFMVTLYFWNSTTTLQFFKSVLWDRNCRWGWEQNLNPDLFYRILGSVSCVVSCADSRSDLTVGRLVWIVHFSMMGSALHKQLHS